MLCETDKYLLTEVIEKVGDDLKRIPEEVEATLSRHYHSAVRDRARWIYLRNELERLAKSKIRAAIVKVARRREHEAAIV